MSKKKIWLIVASVLCALGIAIFIVAMSLSQWDFKKLSTVKYSTNEYSYTESITDISITTTTADIQIVPAPNQTTSVVCHDQENMRHEVKLEEGTLSISIKDEIKKLSDYIGINFDTTKITISLPIRIYTSLSIMATTSDITIKDGFRFESMALKNSTGDIHLTNLSAKVVNVQTSTGDLDIKTLSCESFTSTASTGEVILRDVIATGDITITRSTGDISFKDCDATNLYLKTSTGDIEGTLLTGKNFATKTSTGDCQVPVSSGSGNCEITTTTGDIEIRIA